MRQRSGINCPVWREATRPGRCVRRSGSDRGSAYCHSCTHRHTYHRDTYIGTDRDPRANTIPDSHCIANSGRHCNALADCDTVPNHQSHSDTGAYPHFFSDGDAHADASANRYH